MNSSIRLALYQPDIPQNTGTLLRLGACLDVPVDIIEPTGFTLTEKGLRRSGMDYLDIANMERHVDWTAFAKTQRDANRRLILLTTKAERDLYSFSFKPGDVVLMGRESSGVPHDVHNMVDHRLRIAMQGQARSLNIAVSAAMAVGEALRQVANHHKSTNQKN